MDTDAEPDPARLTAFLSAPVQKHSVMIAGHATSVTLEAPFWAALKRIAAKREITLSSLIEEIDEKRGTSLSSALRLYVLAHATLEQ